jgi:hypothetical protein
VPTYLHWSRFCRFSLIQHQCRKYLFGRTSSLCMSCLVDKFGRWPHTRACKRTRFYLLQTRHASVQNQKSWCKFACRSQRVAYENHQCWEVPGKNVVFHANQCPTINCMVEKGWWNRINIFGFRLPIFHIRSSISGTHWELQLSHWLQNNSLLKTCSEDLLLCLHKTG